MAVKITHTISDDDYKALKKQYEKNKSKLGSTTFEEFLTKSIDVAIKGHIQFMDMNEHMLDLFYEFTKSNSDNNKMKKDGIKIDDLVNKIFQENLNKNQTNDKASNQEYKKDKKKLN